jgi:PAS domain S-box-containing protein
MGIVQGKAPGTSSPVLLIVDDDYGSRLQMRLSLENEGFSVIEAESGMEALGVLRHNRIDLVLLDVVMEGLDGFTTCREIRGLPDGLHLPVVMITGLEDAETIDAAFEAGATDFVTKPINLLILGHRVRYWLRSGAAVQALHVNQARLFKAQEIARLGHWERNLENGAFQFTCSRSEIFGLTHFGSYEALFASVIVDDIVQARKLIDDAYSEGDEFCTQYRINLAEQGVRTLLNQGEVVRKGSSQHLYQVGIIQDITEREAAAESLRQSEKRWRAVFNRSPVGIVLFDRDSTIIDCNQHFTEIFGVPRQQYLGLNLLEKLPAGEVHHVLQQALSSAEGVHRWEGWHTSFFSGKEVYLNIVSEKVSPDLLVVVMADFSEQRQAVVAQEKLQAQLNQAQKMEAVGRLAGGVAHDFNNMLGVIVGRTEMLLELLPPDHALAGDLLEIHSAANRSADLTRQLLAFARKQTVIPKVLDLNQTVTEMLKILQRLIGENIDLLWQPGRDLPPIRIDPSQIDQLLANLCVNARDAISGVGTIRVITSRAPLDDSLRTMVEGPIATEYVVLTVSDDGCGMDEETLANLFEPFFTTKEVGKGTGLGLATIYGIVKQNQGAIDVSSKPGQGTTFRVFLLPHNSGVFAIADKVPAFPVQGGCETVLLVEDEPTLLAMIKRMLEKLGYAVLAAPGPEEAIILAKAQSGNIHVLLTDVVMPQMNGRDLRERICGLHPEVKTLFMSGYTADIIAHQGVVFDGLAFIQKPFSKKDLAARLGEILAR